MSTCQLPIKKAKKYLQQSSAPSTIHLRFESISTLLSFQAFSTAQALHQKHVTNSFSTRAFGTLATLPLSFLSFRPGLWDRPGLGVHIPQRWNFIPLLAEAGDAVVGLDVGADSVLRGQGAPWPILGRHISAIETAAPAAAEAALGRHGRLRCPLHDAGKAKTRHFLQSQDGRRALLAVNNQSTCHMSRSVS
jgi:hypothetical protein